MRESGSKRHSLFASVSFRDIVNVREFSPEGEAVLHEHSPPLASVEEEEEEIVEEKMEKEGQDRSFTQEGEASHEAEEYMEEEEEEEGEEAGYDSIDSPHVGRKSYTPLYRKGRGGNTRTHHTHNLLFLPLLFLLLIQGRPKQKIPLLTPITAEEEKGTAQFAYHSLC